MLPFAKKGDERNNNLVRLQQMFPRIVAADFEHPKHVTAQGRHLLSRMLTSDPSQRITIAEVSMPVWPCSIANSCQRHVSYVTCTRITLWQ